MQERSVDGSALDLMDEASRILGELVGRRCVAAWLGHGDVLFLDIGDEVPPAPEPGEPRPRAPVSLATNYAAWSIDGPVRGTWTDSEAAAESAQLQAAAESLVGERIVGWQLRDRLALRVEFSRNKVLTVQPWPTSDGVSDAWCLSSIDKRILAASNDGRMVVVDEGLPIRDWFREGGAGS